MLTDLYIDDKVKNLPLVSCIKSRLKIPFKIINNSEEVFNLVSKEKDPVKKGKQILFLTKNKGAFFKKCPGTSHYICCDYKILHIGTFCTMDCSYCILQAYFHPPLLQFYVNHKDMTKELDEIFNKPEIFRIGTGEFTDSLIWESWTDIAGDLILKFANQSNSILELKTKTVNIDRLKSLNHNNKTILAWSLNTNRVIKSEERFTSSLKARLKAAANCESWGYKLAFHFDPVVIYEGCEEDYQNVITELFSYVSPQSIVWISIGTFRFMPSLKPIITERFPASKIVYGEFICGLDSKMRYFKPLRIQIYKKLISFIKEKAPDVFVYFCMEDEEIWEKCLGFVPEKDGGLGRMLDKYAIEMCKLNI